jgi:hypothetical protein
MSTNNPPALRVRDIEVSEFKASGLSPADSSGESAGGVGGGVALASADSGLPTCGGEVRVLFSSAGEGILDQSEMGNAASLMAQSSLRATKSRMLPPLRLY